MTRLYDIETEKYEPEVGPVKPRLRAMQNGAQHPLNLYKCAADRIDQLERQIEVLVERILTLEGLQ